MFIDQRSSNKRDILRNSGIFRILFIMRIFGILGDMGKVVTEVAVTVVRAFGIGFFAIDSFKTFLTVAFSSVEVTEPIFIAVVRTILRNFLRNRTIKSYKISIAKTHIYVWVTNAMSIIFYYLIESIYLLFSCLNIEKIFKTIK